VFRVQWTVKGDGSVFAPLLQAADGVGIPKRDLRGDTPAIFGEGRTERIAMEVVALEV
jgi:hypothetical protein